MELIFSSAGYICSSTLAFMAFLSALRHAFSSSMRALRLTACL